MIDVNVQYKTGQGYTSGGPRRLAAVPRIGETLLTGTVAFQVVDVQWGTDETPPTVVAAPKPA